MLGLIQYCFIKFNWCFGGKLYGEKFGERNYEFQLVVSFMEKFD